MILNRPILDSEWPIQRHYSHRQGKRCNSFGGSQKGVFFKGVFLADVPLRLKQEKVTSAACNLTLNTRAKARGGCTFAPRKAHSPKPPFYKTALLFLSIVRTRRCKSCNPVCLVQTPFRPEIGEKKRKHIGFGLPQK